LVEVFWDLTRERLTLGGALVLRQEGEILATVVRTQEIDVRVKGDLDAPQFKRLIREVFGMSTFKFRFSELKGHRPVWPPESAEGSLSYYSFERVLGLFHRFGLPPILNWDPSVVSAMDSLVSGLGRVVSVHLKNVRPGFSEESNFSVSVWRQFFEETADNEDLKFVVIGEDELPGAITKMPNVILGTSLDLTLGQQLALTGRCIGFMGTASGVCTAANFSRIPYVIFKHPSHHTEEMKNELGGSDRFDFALHGQLMRRVVPTTATLIESLNGILYGN
jgi:hypothetical protein